MSSDAMEPVDEPTTPTSRRAFFTGLALGGVSGVLGTWYFAQPFANWNDDNDEDRMFAANDPRGELDHPAFMRQAIEQAMRVPALPFGAVIVDAKSASVVAVGHNRGEENPTYHGEIDAINNLVATAQPYDGKLLVLYTTAEPCPMCQSAIAWTGIEMVVYGTSIPHLQKMGWRQINLRAEQVARRTPFCEITVLGGVLEEECNALFDVVPKKKP